MKYTIINIILLVCAFNIKAQDTTSSIEGNVDNLPVREYHLSIDKKMVNFTGKKVMGMAINDSIPGPTLRFIEGEYAKIHVTNNMDMETSVHWHGLLLPNFYDGVPYLNTPPIPVGETFTYEFALKQSGTYWYHSHTMFQEQSGVYGSIVIEPKEKILDYDSDLVIVFSDWTNEKPMKVLKNLKRRNEWYGTKKGTATPLNKVIAQGGLKAQLKLWRQRMEGADIADIYYPAFLTNGQLQQEYNDFKPEEKVRVRFINAAAATYFWLTFGGDAPLLVANDGLDVVPVQRNKTLFAIAETYDFIVTIPADGKLEIRATAQDGSGSTAAFLGNGEIIPALDVPKPDKIEMMKSLAKMKMKMGAPALKAHPRKDTRLAMKEKYGMQMDMKNNSDDKMDHSNMNMDMSQDTMPKNKMNHGNIKEEMTNMPNHEKMEMLKDSMLPMMDMQSMDKMESGYDYSYDFLRSPQPTTFAKDIPVKKILLNLTGNMNRYIWSINGIPLSETDNIKIKQGEVTRITLNNLTMMHHPMHIHGHFFRVINKNGEYSPLKHTVNVPPMKDITIEFYGNEYGDWIFHCHVLYHMMGGMTRIFSYDTPSDPRMAAFPVLELVHETNKTYSWGMANVASHMTGIELTSSNIRNQFNFSAEFGYNKNYEAEISYERYISDYTRVFVGVNAENSIPDSLNVVDVTAVAGMRFLTPYLFNLDVRVNHKLRPRISIGRSILLFPRFSIFGYYEYQADFGVVSNLENGKKYEGESVWNAGVEYMLSRNFSLMANYDNRYGVGGGLSILF